MLRASGETLEGPRPSDLFDLVIDAQGDLTLVLIDLHAGADTPGSQLGNAMRKAREALEAREPLHAVVSALELYFAEHPGLEAGISLLRFSQATSRVEILNAGMPPIAHLAPGAHFSLHAALSSPIGRKVGEVHAYELVPLIWGGVWLIASDGFTAGSLDPEPLRELAAKLDLAGSGRALSAQNSEGFYDKLLAAVPRARFLRDDATLVVVCADPNSRFESGIVAR
jgi:hypothetical protein